jgi:protein involved in polysaccharide export with SLBB domain
MNQITLRIIYVFVVLLLINPLIALSQNSQNVSTVNVDQLTDQQIMQLLQQAQKAGLTDDQVVQQAQAKGMSASEASKLQDRIKEIRSNNHGFSDTTSFTNRTLNYVPDRSDTLIQQNNSKRIARLPVFGANLFRNNNIRFEPNLNLATPTNYVLGPNDQLNINVYGNSTVNWKLNISPEGNINIPGVGVVNVGGRTIEQATTLIKNKLSTNNYSVGRGTSVQVTLGNIRSIKVIMVGQLVRPGTYTLPSLATVFNALYAAGGPSDNGSFRQVQIIRNNKIVKTLDVYDFLVKGDQKNNIILQDQDVIRVPTYRTLVELYGQVKIPAKYEVLPGETLQTVLNFAGGFTDTAYTARIIVSQVSDQQRRLTDVVESDYQNYIPLSGDKYFVRSILNRYENRVTIKGAVFRPGEYELQKGMTLLQLIQNAAGLKEDAFTGRGTILRLKPDNSTELISFNLKNVINKTSDILLKREDIVNISSIFDLRDSLQVTVYGQVREPGTYPFADSMKVADLILKAGGLTQGASSMRIEVARRINNADPESKSSAVANVFTINIDKNLKPGAADFVLEPFDIVSVYNLPGYEKQKTVRVEGQVLYPGVYTLQKKDEKISDIVSRAGGLTVSADIEGATLRRENIAILGVDKNTTDVASLKKEQEERINHLQKVYKDSANADSMQMRNNYIGIDMAAILKSPGSKEDLLLEDGDMIRVPKQQQVVRVNGEVLYPSAVIYKSGESFKAYVLNAGGFAPDALKKGAYIIYPNGTVKGTRKFLFFNSHPKVKPGSEIFVPQKPPRNPNSVQEILGLTTGLASLGAIILGIISLHR